MDWWRSFFICSISIKQRDRSIECEVFHDDTHKNTTKNTYVIAIDPKSISRSLLPYWSNIYLSNHTGPGDFLGIGCYGN